jgi:hypothetical protein
MEIGGKACESHILSVPYRRIVPVTPLQIAVTRGHLNMCGLLKLKLPCPYFTCREILQNNH